MPQPSWRKAGNQRATPNPLVQRHFRDGTYGQLPEIPRFGESNETIQCPTLSGVRAYVEQLSSRVERLWLSAELFMNIAPQSYSTTKARHFTSYWCIW